MPNCFQKHLLFGRVWEKHAVNISVLYSFRVVFNEVVQTSKYYMRDVTAVESSWLVELAPHFYKQAKVCQTIKADLLHLIICY